MSAFTHDETNSLVSNRKEKKCEIPHTPQGKPLKSSQYFGENVFNPLLSKSLTKQDKDELNEVIHTSKPLTKDLAKKVANAVLEWALEKGASHFTHWFHPLTGGTAEKHDSFLSFDDERPVEKLSASQLMQGEPDASSFPNGGTRSTFEARGYTTWDLTSPIFIQESANGKTLVIPTAFVSYHGNALDIKTPLLRSINRLNEVATEFCQLAGEKNVKKIDITVGLEQEYFLIDKAFYFSRPDLVMTGRTLVGSITQKNQQLEDHYFGRIPERVLAFMQEVEIELYKVGIPAKTRHNEVAPGQFELAPIFKDANVAADQNMVVMATLQTVALKHDFVCLLHEKPFAGINGSGKHCNWSMSTDTGSNLLEPGTNPHENHRFLAVTAMVVEAVRRHGELLRVSIASTGNDHRLGANEAPPSIISAFLGETLTAIFDSLLSGQKYTPNGGGYLDLGANQLANLLKDNSDRNRTSPFAFTGNKFEFRAVGSSQAVGFPLSILNTAVADVIAETNEIFKKELAAGKDVETILIDIAKTWYGKAKHAVFNGDGYSQEWVEEAKRRGLANFRTTPEALTVLKDDKYTSFLVKHGVYRNIELQTRYNVMLERYIKLRSIEFNVLRSIVDKNILPGVFQFKATLADTIEKQKKIGVDSSVEETILRNVSGLAKDLYTHTNNLASSFDNAHKGHDEEKFSLTIAKELMPLAETVGKTANQLEQVVPTAAWSLPSFYDMLFIR